MQLIEETYFGWDSLTHVLDCPNPTWDDVQIRHDEGTRPDASGTDPHTCTNALCSHRTTFTRLQLRLLCRDCHTVRIISGEGSTETCTTTADTGWGQTPHQTGGVWLWPGRPTAPGGEPHQYLVTLQPAALTRATLYGIITAYRDSNGVQRWIAGCAPDPDGAHPISTLRWRYASNAYDTAIDAAEFIDITHRFPQRPVVVAV
ncbi:hypothetical protein [Streptomyces chartreusis]|uniref:hypothetical protein n=1 Tax=Streptomyces chartreusis TaxID=1969 RepID=UPI0033D1673C